jgi:hypothetical protein
MSRYRDEQPEGSPGQGDDDGGDSVARAWPDSGLGRRDLLRSAGVLLPSSRVLSLRASPTGAAASVLLAAGQAAAQTPAAPAAAAKTGGQFLSHGELLLLDELSEIIVPTDEHSPGARAAKVAEEIDRRLAEGPGYDQDAVDERRRWREGLALVDELARRTHGLTFLSATPAQRLALVTTMAAGEKNPKKPEEQFFRTLKEGVAEAYYHSEIGVKQEMEYKGNSYLQEFAGHDASTVPLRRKT